MLKKSHKKGKKNKKSSKKQVKKQTGIIINVFSAPSRGAGKVVSQRSPRSYSRVNSSISKALNLIAKKNKEDEIKEPKISIAPKFHKDVELDAKFIPYEKELKEGIRHRKKQIINTPNEIYTDQLEKDFNKDLEEINRKISEDLNPRQAKLLKSNIAHDTGLKLKDGELYF